MPQNQNSSCQTKTLVISLIAISLAACSSGNQTSNTEVNPTTPSPSSLASSPSSQVANLALLEVTNIGEISFKAAGNSSGFFDTVNRSTAATVEVPKATSITATGWAILPEQGKPADRVILTSGENNSIVAVAPVNLDRPDVAQALKNPAYRNSGWSTTFNPSTSLEDKVVLKAWAYNSTSKEATQLNSSHEVVVIE